MTRERIASSLARPPALRMTWASPSARPAYLAGSRRASIQVRMAKLRAGGRARLALAPKLAAYDSLAERTSVRILLMVRSPGCGFLMVCCGGFVVDWWCELFGVRIDDVDGQIVVVGGKLPSPVLL